MKFNIHIITISFVFSELLPECHSVRIPLNCTKTYSSQEQRYVPYTEIYTARNFFGLKRNKTRISYRLENVTTEHEENVCCQGYVKLNDDNWCDPVCIKTCGENGFCMAPETCGCKDGYEMNQGDNKCQPICEEKCINGFCSSPNVCTCNRGFYSESHNLCKPKCHSCSENEYCYEPDECKCVDGYIKDNYTAGHYLLSAIEHKCRPICDKGCVNSNCIKPNVCECYEGYEYSKDDLFTCLPKCTPGCENSQCSGPNVCTCLEGYTKTASSNICEPTCTPKCINAECTSPNICACLIGFEPLKNETNICQPHCSSPCINGRCSNPEQCSCNAGYEIKNDKFICEPVCTEPCIMGNCTSPGNCTCFDSYQLKEDSKSVCEPICHNNCINGQCTAPEQCTCNIGYERTNLTHEHFKCIPICECEHGYCSETSSFCLTCMEGYHLVNENNTSICEPYCEDDCINGKCIAPQTCKCNEDYVFSNDSVGNTVCTHICGSECIHGICLKEIGNCSCNNGWSGKYCDESQFCSISILENDAFYSQLNESTAFDELENETMIDQSWPPCDRQCLNKIDNSTKCIFNFNEKESNFTCLIELDLECNIDIYFQSQISGAEINITLAVICSILTLIVIVIVTYGVILMRRNKKPTVELIGSFKSIPGHSPDAFLYENDNSSISL